MFLAGKRRLASLAEEAEALKRKEEEFDLFRKARKRACEKAVTGFPEILGN